MKLKVTKSRIKAWSNSYIHSTLVLCWILLTTVTLSSRSVFATNYYLQAAGINEFDSSQNHYQFYADSIQFNNFCTQTKNNCENYINTDSNLIPSEFKPMGKITTQGTPTRKLILDRITQLIAKAKEPDQIIISMINHGSPGTSEKDTSCIYLSANEKICDGDLQPLLKKLKPGVKIAIFAEGCFSGGFAKLANSQVCVAATADQNLVSYGLKNSKNGKWNYMLSKKIKKMSDISDLRRGNEEITLRSGSDMMKINACAIVVDKIKNNLQAKYSINFTEHLIEKIKGEAKSCLSKYDNGESVTNYSLRSLGESLKVVDKLSSEIILKEVCANSSNGAINKEICEGWKSLLNNKLPENVLKSKVIYEASKKRLAEALELNVDLPPTERMKFQEEVLKEVSDQISGRNFKETWELHEYIDRLRTNKNVGKRAREIYKAYNNFRNEQLTYQSETQQFEKDQKKSKSKVSNFIQDCLMQGYDRFTYDQALQASSRDEVKQRHNFTEKEFEEAKKCENTFQF